jgi:Fe-S-cluster containining protein
MRKLKVLPPMQCDIGCGACCGVIPVTATEYNRIAAHMKAHGIALLPGSDLACPLYQDGRCSVYKVRPLICRIFGHSEHLECERGYKANVPEREIRRMTAANGMPTRLLQEMRPGHDRAFVDGWLSVVSDGWPWLNGKP